MFARSKLQSLLRLTLLSIFLSFGLQFEAQAASSSISISDEVYGNNAASRANAALLDDDWASSYPGGSASIPDLFSGASGYTGSKTFEDSIGSDYSVKWGFGHLDEEGPGTPTSITFVPVTSGALTIGTSNSIQSGAPNPLSSHTRISTGYSSPDGLDAIKFDFSNSPTDIYAFGVFLGDLESRANNGTTARVILLDDMGDVIGDHPIIFTGEVITSSGVSSYMAVEPAGSPTGPNNNPGGKWGNKTTVFVSVKSDTVVASAIIHVGDDDHTSNYVGAQEHFGITGFQVPSEPYAPGGTAILAAEKIVETYDVGGYALPGQDVVYTISVENEGTGAVDDDSIVLIDSLPNTIIFYNGDMDDAGPATGPVLFSQSSGAGLNFDDLADVKYSDAAAKPADFSSCNYAPVMGYDVNVKHICLNPKGGLVSGSPFPAASFKFRAQIR